MHRMCQKQIKEEILTLRGKDSLLGTFENSEE